MTRLLEAGINAVKAGNKEEGGRYLRMSIKNESLSGALLATAYLWYAETRDDPNHKRAAYGEALKADPNNVDAKQRMAALLSANLPTPPPTMPGDTPPPMMQPVMTPVQAPPPTLPDQPQARSDSAAGLLVQVIGGPNGTGTAFFVTQDGLLVTTRYIVGGQERVTVELSPGRQIPAQVVRAFPEIDIAILHTGERLNALMPITAYPKVPDDATLMIRSAGGQQISANQRPSKRVMAAHWIPTNITTLPDAGGDAIFDDRQALVGMMTRNSARNSGYYFGIHIGTIRRYVEHFVGEMQSGQRRSYCPSCGSVSAATAAGYFYCEVCGSSAPHVRHQQRYPQGDIYVNASTSPCPICASQAGLYTGKCLRCGQEPTYR